MSKIEILKDLFFIERGYLNGNHFVFRSEHPILIDTGYIGDFNATQRSISELGVNFTDIALIINTHTHCDHIGGNHIIQEKSDCDIAMHRIGRHFIDTRDDWATWWRYFHQEAEFFRCTQTLVDGDIIHIGPHQFQVIYTPGHASDGIVLYNPKDRILISSDTLWENNMAVMTLRIEGSTALFRMQESLQKIASLDVDIVYPGHGKPFKEMQKAIARSQAKIEGYLLDRDRIGNDLLKKIIVYTLLMRKSVNESGFFPYLMQTHWFKETIDLYFNKDYKTKYDEVMDDFLEREIIQRDNGHLYTTVKP